MLNPNEDDEPGISLTSEEIELLRETLQTEMSQWDDQKASHDLWSKLEAVTDDLSQQLCEQLRTVLEPMLATRLKGDYRSGKRINIKKIIPYIASQFRKDKIWLRRTKPNKRNYQVMVAIDDSASMRSNGAHGVALEALTLLSRALSRLEVGQLALVNFGDAVKLLHPFEQPFTSETGAYAVSRFEFKQENTNWLQFLEATSKLFEAAKATQTGSSDNFQLLFVISDARVQQDRERVARWTREALSRRQLIVLIVLDSCTPSQSILNLKSVTYPKGKLKVTDYLDDFPFPFYIILSDIKALPEIIADALRQWFELSKNMS